MNDTQTIAQFKDYKWNKIGDLKDGRYAHSSITLNAITMTLGGYIKSYEDVSTEFWNLEISEGEIFGPKLPRGDYSYGTGLFLVEKDYCKIE